MNEVEDLVRQALDEDAPSGDLTTSLAVPRNLGCRAQLQVGGPGVLAGTEAAEAVFRLAADRVGLGRVEVHWKVSPGDRVAADDVVAVVEGPAWSVLLAERVAINFLGHLSGVASLTAAFVAAASPATVLCTRKTTPGLRALERKAVATGGGSLHRGSLSEAVLIKDNHLRIAGGLEEAVRPAKAKRVAVEVEAETLEEVEEALAAGADRILLDNPTPELVSAALAKVKEPARLEVSGGVTLDSVGALVAAGARLLSVGRLTHSAPALDLSLEVTDVFEL